MIQSSQNLQDIIFDFTCLKFSINKHLSGIKSTEANTVFWSIFLILAFSNNTFQFYFWSSQWGLSSTVKYALRVQDCILNFETWDIQCWQTLNTTDTSDIITDINQFTLGVFFDFFQNSRPSEQKVGVPYFSARVKIDGISLLGKSLLKVQAIYLQYDFFPIVILQMLFILISLSLMKGNGPEDMTYS